MTMTSTVAKLLATLGPQYGTTQNVLLLALLGAWGAKLDDARRDSDAALAQLSVTTASTYWLDLWGQLYAIPRLTGESDDAYGTRIILQTIRQRPQPLALEQIVKQAFSLVDFFVRDLWPFVLLSDQWTTPPGKPLQVSDGQLRADFFTFGPNLVTVSFSSTYSPGNFGLWISELTSQLLTYTLQDIINRLPLVLLSDQFASTLQVSDGQLTTPGLGTPADTARHSLQLPPIVLPVSVTDILALINQHRAAGTKPVVIATQLQSVG